MRHRKSVDDSLPMVYSTDMETTRPDLATAYLLAQGKKPKHATRAVRRKAAALIKRKIGPSRASITDVAHLLGVSVAAVSRWVSGERLPNADMTRKILGGKS